MRTPYKEVKVFKTLENQKVRYASLDALNNYGDWRKLPYSLRVLAENIIRHGATEQALQAFGQWLVNKTSNYEFGFRPSRVLMQDFTGVPAVVDLAAMRDAIVRLGGDPEKVNPLISVDLVVDHSVQVDFSGDAEALRQNIAKEFERNGERYAFLKWAQGAFDNFRLIPPGAGICHQVNLEYLSHVVMLTNDGLVIPDTCVGTDSHTVMENGLSVLGWGVGGIEAEAAMLGQPISMTLPEVVGVRLVGALPEGTCATDLVLTITNALRKKGVVGKFVEFCGSGLDTLSLADRATLANMAPEYGATCGFFPIDDETIRYLRLTGRDEQQVQLVEAYAKANGFWRTGEEPLFTDVVEINLGDIVASVAGPKKPQELVALSEVSHQFADSFAELAGHEEQRGELSFSDGNIAIAAITSCTNTSNPAVMIAAGLVARKARAHGLSVPSWVKTSLAPGSQVVADYLQQSGLQQDLDALGFNIVAFGCTTCIGGSGDLAEEITEAIRSQDLLACSVLSGNRNFEGRVHPLTKANYLMSPPLVVAYAIAGNIFHNLLVQPLGYDANTGEAVHLADIWPTSQEIQQVIAETLSPEMFRSRYAAIMTGSAEWQAVPVSEGTLYDWPESTYIANPPYFEGMQRELPAIANVCGARPLGVFGNAITTDHISPAGNIKADSPAGCYLQELGVAPADFNSYGARRGNHHVMVRGTFANIRLQNEMTPDRRGGWTTVQPKGETVFIYDASISYANKATPLVVIGGQEYGAGSSRDWAAKGPFLLGIKAAIVESFERIHRSNLIGMGVLPLQFPDGVTRQTLGINGTETFDVLGLEDGLFPRMTVGLVITRADGTIETVDVNCRIDTEDEVAYYLNGGIMQYVLRQLLAA
jgi:aconitate hydratase